MKNTRNPVTSTQIVSMAIFMSLMPSAISFVNAGAAATGAGWAAAAGASLASSSAAHEIPIPPIDTINSTMNSPRTSPVPQKLLPCAIAVSPFLTSGSVI